MATTTRTGRGNDDEEARLARMAKTTTTTTTSAEPLSLSAAMMILRLVRSERESLGDAPAVVSFFQRLEALEKQTLPSCNHHVILVEPAGETTATTMALLRGLQQQMDKHNDNDTDKKVIVKEWPLVQSTKWFQEIASSLLLDGEEKGLVAQAFAVACHGLWQDEIRQESVRNPRTVFWVNCPDRQRLPHFEWFRPCLWIRVGADKRDKDTPSNASRTVTFPSFQRQTTGPREILHLSESDMDASQLETVTRAISDRLMRQFRPWQHFQRAPLEFFCFTSSQLGLCDPDTGRRCKHKPWAFQYGVSSAPDSPPYLKTVGIHTVDSSGVLFFSHATGGDGNFVPASFCCVMGEYPTEQQWRAEGFLMNVSSMECQLQGQFPPPSLVAQVLACQQAESSLDHKEQHRQRFDAPPTHAPMAQELRREEATCCDCPDAPGVRATRFIPLRMEVLIGGPSSPGGPQRWEWQRTKSHDDTTWTPARLLLPFSSPSRLSQIPALTAPTLLPMTIAITGTHCAGKATIGKRLAQILQCPFHGELGDSLRDSRQVVPGGHLCGGDDEDDASAPYDETPHHDNGGQWDRRVYQAEQERDARHHEALRVVETWHVGNLAWGLLRLEKGETSSSQSRRRQELLDTTRRAMAAEVGRACVLLVHLTLDSFHVTVERRQEDGEAGRVRLPLENEEKDCQDLYMALDVKVRNELLPVFGAKEIATLEVDNSVNGDEAMDKVIGRIIKFIQENQWRRGVASE